MNPRITIVTLGTRDFDRSLRFYRDGLGFPHQREGRRPHRLLPDRRNTACLVSAPAFGRRYRCGAAPFTRRVRGRDPRAHVEQREQVPQVLELARAAGATILKSAEDAFWGGFHGYFADPDGYPWEVAWGPMFSFSPTGELVIAEG
jgi:catechol 2,3-dioxygenase-like lactoylglutathione lyase family enzyme